MGGRERNASEKRARTDLFLSFYGLSRRLLAMRPPRLVFEPLQTGLKSNTCAARDIIKRPYSICFLRASSFYWSNGQQNKGLKNPATSSWQNDCWGRQWGSRCCNVQSSLPSSFLCAWCFLLLSFVDVYALNVDLNCFSSFLMASEVFCSIMRSITMKK